MTYFPKMLTPFTEHQLGKINKLSSVLYNISVNAIYFEDTAKADFTEQRGMLFVHKEWPTLWNTFCRARFVWKILKKQGILFHAFYLVVTPYVRNARRCLLGIHRKVTV